MEKLKMHSPNLTDANIAKIREMFPGCVTEAAGEDGQIRLAVDFDQLRQELSDHIIEGPQERYHLNWPGKREALLTANAPIAKTLRPARDESLNFDTTNNLFIEGDNLEALKLLQETYLGKIKLIYIDPPYNTGNDFIYADDFSTTSGAFLRNSSQADENGIRLVANTETNGRFHSDWLSMIYPRLKIARTLLHNSGVLCVSIDDNECANLKTACDEVLGSSNFLGVFAVKSTPNARNYGHIARMHDYCLMYGKDSTETITYELEVPDKEFKYQDEKGGFNIHPLYNSDESFHKGNRPNLYYPIYLSPDRRLYNDFFELSPEQTSANQIPVYPPKSEKNDVQFVWRWGREKVAAGVNRDIIGYQNPDGSYRIVRKMRHTTQIIRSMFLDKEYSGRRGTSEVEALFGSKVFSFPKPIALISRLLEISTRDNDLIMDFFAGSCTTAHAVMDINKRDGGSRRFIVVQLPELIGAIGEGANPAFQTIAEIGKERIRRAGKELTKEAGDTGWSKDIGFRVLKVDTSNMAEVFYAPDQTAQKGLLNAVDNIKPDRSAEDLLFQVLVDWGVDLTLPIRRETVQKKTVFFVDENALVACFDTGLTEDLVKELAKHQPLRVVFRDTGFVSDAVKINASQIFRQLSPTTEVKSI